MEPRPIDANALPYGPAIVGDEGGWTEKIIAIPKSAVDAAPTLDYAPVVHAEWVLTPFRIRYGYPCASWKCSHCGNELFLDPRGRIVNYCPNCGARMDGGKNDVQKVETQT